MTPTSLIPPDTSSAISVHDAILALAFVGDLSMGRPVDHSPRTARLAAWLAEAAGASHAEVCVAYYASLLRWSGCSANASGFAALLGDDVMGRNAMLSYNMPKLTPAGEAQIDDLAQIHCEVSGDIAVQLGMSPQVEATLRHIFERWDGGGKPGLLAGAAIPVGVFFVGLASDLEILSKVYGNESALQWLTRLSNIKYPDHLVGLTQQHAIEWLAQLEQPDLGLVPELPATRDAVPLELIADVIDLKLPWLAGYSRQVAQAAHAAAISMGLAPALQTRLYRAGLLHGMGRAAVPNHLWDKPGALSTSEWERVRLVPYWTSRAARPINQLAAEAELASHVYERLDGDGHFRGLAGAALGLPEQILGAAAACVALRSPRPWRPALGEADTAALLYAEAGKGRFDPQIIAALTAAAPRAAGRTAGVLSEREAEVLGRISVGESNKEVARSLKISPSTVGTHIESIFRKLGCSTRAAATLKAFTLGLL